MLTGCKNVLKSNNMCDGGKVTRRAVIHSERRETRSAVTRMRLDGNSNMRGYVFEIDQ